MFPPENWACLFQYCKNVWVKKLHWNQSQTLCSLTVLSRAEHRSLLKTTYFMIFVLGFLLKIAMAPAIKTISLGSLVDRSDSLSMRCQYKLLISSEISLKEQGHMLHALSPLGFLHLAMSRVIFSKPRSKVEGCQCPPWLWHLLVAELRPVTANPSCPVTKENKETSTSFKPLFSPVNLFA